MSNKYDQEKLAYTNYCPRCHYRKKEFDNKIVQRKYVCTHYKKKNTCKVIPEGKDIPLPELRSAFLKVDWSQYPINSKEKKKEEKKKEEHEIKSMLVIQKELIRLLEKKASRTWAEINFKKLRLLYLGGNEFISTIDGKKYSEHGEIIYII
tara:strand:- start:256 stop:708 length:453 start_codon:yes stop_codon:yes gene_type:complete